MPGIITSHRSKNVDEFTGQAFDYVLTVCDNAKESCPVFFGSATRLHHSFNDPVAVQGSEESGWRSFAVCGTNCGRT
jgi:arsenate reductase